MDDRDRDGRHGTAIIQEISAIVYVGGR